MAAAGIGALLIGETAPPIARAAPATESTRLTPAPAYDPPQTGERVALLAGGCFWGAEGVFEHVKGVKSVTSGYAGGTTRNPTYESTSTGKTGHAETVRIVYDPAVVSYGALLRIFFSVVHDATLKDRQGPDIGSQYRGAIFPLDADQRAVADRYMAQMTAAKTFARPIATRVEGAARFTPAEAYHQDFMRKNPRHGYILRWDVPKVQAFKARFPLRWKA